MFCPYILPSWGLKIRLLGILSFPGLGCLKTPWLQCIFLITEDPSTDFMKPVDTSCSRGSRTPVCESKVAEGKPLGFLFWDFFFLTVCHLLREGETYAILHCLYWVYICISAKKHQEWKSFSIKGRVKAVKGEGREELWFSEQKKLEEIFLRSIYSLSVVCPVRDIEVTILAFSLPNYLKTVIFIPRTPIFFHLLSLYSSNKTPAEFG